MISILLKNLLFVGYMFTLFMTSNVASVLLFILCYLLNFESCKWSVSISIIIHNGGQGSSTKLQSTS